MLKILKYPQVWLLAAAATAACAQTKTVSIRVPDKVSAGTAVPIVVENRTDSAIGVCIDIGASVTGAAGRKEPSPHPFIVQQRHSQGWSELLTGTDVGNARAPLIIDAADSLPFDIQLRMPGHYRLTLRYLQGAISGDMQCPITDDTVAKEAVSRTFAVQRTPKAPKSK